MSSSYMPLIQTQRSSCLLAGRIVKQVKYTAKIIKKPNPYSTMWQIVNGCPRLMQHPKDLNPVGWAFHFNFLAPDELVT